jgi:hypothetical protein
MPQDRARRVPEPAIDDAIGQGVTSQLSQVMRSPSRPGPAAAMAGCYTDLSLKGRFEARVTLGNDYCGQEAKPMPSGSKLLYVVLTRGPEEDHHPDLRAQAEFVDLPARHARSVRRLTPRLVESPGRPGQIPSAVKTLPPN